MKIKMSRQSFIYRHIRIYRVIMNILYRGKYKNRFSGIFELLKDILSGGKVLELCFGDIYIANFCKSIGLKWTGFDINENFVKMAGAKGHDAQLIDISSLSVLPKADVCIIMGSLYHFHPQKNVMLSKMFEASDIVIISEPVINLSSNTGLLGFFAKRSANVGKRHETFRFNKVTFLNFVEENSKVLNYHIETLHDNGKDILVKLVRNRND